jgi:hypothetical protein
VRLQEVSISSSFDEVSVSSSFNEVFVSSSSLRGPSPIGVDVGKADSVVVSSSSTRSLRFVQQGTSPIGVDVGIAEERAASSSFNKKSLFLHLQQEVSVSSYSQEVFVSSCLAK